MKKRIALLEAKTARISARTNDGAELASRWFALAEAHDLDRLWRDMAVL